MGIERDDVLTAIRIASIISTEDDFAENFIREFNLILQQKGILTK